MFVVVLRAQIARVLLPERHHANGSLRLIAVRDCSAVGFRKSESDCCRSHASHLDGAEVRIDGVFLHKRVTDIQSAEYGGNDDGHVAHDYRHRHAHGPYKDEILPW